MALFSNSLSVTRQYLSAAVGDLIRGTADSGSETTIVDTMLTKPSDYYNNYGYKCYIYEGINIGEERVVSTWVLGSTNTLTLTPAFTAAITSASKYELHRIFTQDDYRKAINMAIEGIAGKYLIDLIDETTVLVADTYEYDLPLSFLYLYKVTTEQTAAGGVWDAEAEIDPRNWSINKSYAPALKLDERYYSIVAGKYLRLEGQGAQPLVTADTSVIYLPIDWLVQKAITFLPQEKIQSNKLENTFKQAILLSSKEPRAYPHPEARAIVE